ncbi:MFS transporter [Streptomyces sp. NPDC052727]|uniref:MFS transporter n=1 Tax=Streptomyces sp. NPDC052727 TaxID=3154854 RepID=UPI0034404A62
MTGITVPTSRSRRPLVILLCAGFISVLGTSMSELALPWFALGTGGGTSHAGVVAFADTAPYVVLQALSGPVVDKWGARASCAAGNALAAVALGAVPVLHLAGALGFGPLCALVAVSAMARGVADCAGNVLLPAVAERTGVPLARAVALSAGAMRGGLIAGAALAGVLLSTVGVTSTLAVTAGAFAVASVLVMSCATATARRPATAPRAGGAPGGYRAELAEGLRFLRGDRLLLGIVVLIAVSNLLDQAFSAVLLPAWVKAHLDSPQALGLITGTIGVGTVAGSVAGAWLGPRLRRSVTFRTGFLLAGAPRFLALCVCSTLAPVLTVSLVAGIAGGLVNPLLGVLQYERIPPRLQARVLGAVKASAWAGIPFGGLLAGLAAGSVGVTAALAATGLAFLLTSLVPFVLPSWRAMDTSPAPAPAEVRCAGSG